MNTIDISCENRDCGIAKNYSLRQLESELRRNIAVQNQLKVQIERMQFDIINHESVIIYLSNIFYLINRKKIMTMIKFYF